MKELTVFNKTTEIVLSWKKLERQRQIRGVGSSGGKNCVFHMLHSWMEEVRITS